MSIATAAWAFGGNAIGKTSLRFHFLPRKERRARTATQLGRDGVTSGVRLTVNKLVLQFWITRLTFVRLSQCGSTRTTPSSIMRLRKWENLRSSREMNLFCGTDLWLPTVHQI